MSIVTRLVMIAMGSFFKLLLAIAVIAAVTSYVQEMVTNRGDVDVADMSEIGADSARFGEGGVSNEYYIQPKLSTKESMFCKGGIKSESCEERPLNPMFENAKVLGEDIPERRAKRKYTDHQSHDRFSFWSFLFGD